mmetsp:Transcript_4695/g.6161  ORF Transcript_4695/g.6161 Transcript_4695/m.6161 type:complete len:415 (-) Transcript_4695:103-1347(-)|eukprot:CAMPEP_0195255958 /NCGR_PEP_ID=MMETSP0706-20130129/5954_1 /TAXON_ID=33640 /ORGANISM="Asterionellopsis glacialis, Strain CCMP134" /LENGTH=414 /DNA_ID=CAMNT_0040308917 /DNA_START=13 /DNA_END=1257 /DNA_ORIENTATION=+
MGAMDLVEVEEGKRAAESEEKEEEKEQEVFVDEYATKPGGVTVAGSSSPSKTAKESGKQLEAIDASSNKEEVKGNQESTNEKHLSSEQQQERTKKGAKHPPGKQKKEKKREINEKFKDVHATGKWGDISKTEIYVGIAIGVAIVIGAIVAAVLLIGRDEESLESPTSSPTSFPTLSSSSTIDTILLAHLTTASLSETNLPSDSNFYTNKYTVEVESPAVRAMSWILEVDQRIHGVDYIADRFALAAFYYGTQGKEWKNNTGWLSSSSVCDWYGIVCNDRLGTIEDVILIDNNLANNIELDVPSIPSELALLSTLRALIVSSNKLKGGIQSATFLDLKSLSVLFLDNNQLDGTIPEGLSDVGLSSLFLQGNDELTGRFIDFCNGSRGPKPPLLNFGIDCGSIRACPCCDKTFNCY